MKVGAGPDICKGNLCTSAEEEGVGEPLQPLWPRRTVGRRPWGVDGRSAGERAKCPG